MLSSQCFLVSGNITAGDVGDKFEWEKGRTDVERQERNGIAIRRQHSPIVKVMEQAGRPWTALLLQDEGGIVGSQENGREIKSPLEKQNDLLAHLKIPGIDVDCWEGSLMHVHGAICLHFLDTRRILLNTQLMSWSSEFYWSNNNTGPRAVETGTSLAGSHRNGGVIQREIGSEMAKCMHSKIIQV